MSIQGFFTSPAEEADASFKAGDFSKAAAIYRQILTGDPANASAWRGLGISLIQTGAMEEALEACQRAASLQPGSADCRYAHGYALGALKRFSEAIAELDAALTLQPNHGPARQVLVYALIQHGQSIAADDPRLAETYLERAVKIDHRNPNTVAPYLEHLRVTGQKGKAAQAISHLDPALKADPIVKPVLDKMHDDPSFHQVLHQAERNQDNVVKRAVVQAPAQSSINYVPCPNCRQQIADYAAICPHCNFQNRAVGTFAGRDTGPNYVWQEVAFTIVSIIWILNAGWSIWDAVRMPGMVRDFMLTLGVANAAIGIGMIARNDLAMTIAKFLCYVNLLFASYGVVFGLMLGRWGSFAGSLFTLSLAGFLIYLINYTSDV